MLKANPIIPKKILVISTVALFLVSMLFFTLPGKVYGATLTVGPGGTYSTIQAAIDAASPGDTISVAAGTYNEHLVINTPNLTIKGENKTTTIIDATQDPSWTVAKAGILIRGTGESKSGASNVTISGFTIRNAELQTGGVSYTGEKYGVGAGGMAGVQIYGSSGNTITDNIFEKCGWQVWVLAEWQAAGYGNSENNTISNNKIDDCVRQGVYLYSDGSVSVKNTKIQNNDISNAHGNYVGIRIMGEGITSPITDTTIESNKITGCSRGIRISDADVSGISIHQNSISGNTLYGIQNELSTVIDATNNWWGSASGPYNATSNPGGTGDPVSDNVNFTPWLTSDPFAAAPSTLASKGYVQQTVGAGTVTVSTSGAYATVTGSGGQTITIEGITSGTASAEGFLIAGANIYFDLKISSSEGIDKIQFTILGGAGIPRWWNGSEWIECSDYTIDANGNVTITITSSTSPTLSDLIGTVFTIFGKPWVRTGPMVCHAVWVNEKGNFQFIFWYPYRDNNWVKIYDMSGKEVFSIDMPLDNPQFEVSLPDGMYTVKTFTVGSTEPIQTFIIGKDTNTPHQNLGDLPE